MEEDEEIDIVGIPGEREPTQFNETTSSFLLDSSKIDTLKRKNVTSLLKNNENYENNVTNILIFDQEIPIMQEEEVIHSNSSSLGNPSVTRHPRSLLKTQKFNQPEVKFKTSIMINKSLFDNNKNTEQSTLPDSKPKPISKKELKKAFKANRKPAKSSNRKRNLLKDWHGNKKKKPRKSSVEVQFGEHITINHDEDPLNKEEVVKINKSVRHDDSDLEVDIEYEERKVEEKSVVEDITENVVSEPDNMRSEVLALDQVVVHTGVKELLESLETPTNEEQITLESVTILERFVHSEFFENRPTKTQQRYLRIRNHIISSWENTKPNYVTKTAVRNGLKNCGDVNCISRIHLYLEQLGIINFGHDGEYFNYIRPLYKILGMLSPRFCTEVKPLPKSTNQLPVEKKIIRQNRRQQYPVEGAADNRKEPSKVALRKHNSLYELVKCENNYINQFNLSVSLRLSTLCCLQLHSMSSSSEVMGFVGGFRKDRELFLTRYKPCKTKKSSGIMCEACEVSQVEQSNSLLTEGLDLLGWFHSHPLFPPNPSHQDIQTQSDLQVQFARNNELFVGLILSCVDMRLKCFYTVDLVPYEIQVEVVVDIENMQNEIKEVLGVLQGENQNLNEILKKFCDSGGTLLRRYGIIPGKMEDFISLPSVKHDNKNLK